MQNELKLRPVGKLSRVAENVHLKRKAGVYLIRCSRCSQVAYVGKSKEVLVRLITHAYIPPYGVVDLIIGDVIRPDKRDKWSRLCSHLKAVSKGTRRDVAGGLEVEVCVPDDPGSIDALESQLLSSRPPVFGNGRHVWGSTHLDDFTEYWSGRAGGGIPNQVKQENTRGTV